VDDPNSSQERRRDARTRISLPAVLVRRGGDDQVEMVDASFRGLFLRMQYPPPVRQVVKLRIKLPARELEAHGVVVRIVEDAYGRAGVGLRFFALNGQDRADWEMFIASAIRSQGRSVRAA
jgi:hypothetical protein